jgi:hypothetical protein
MRRTSGGGSIDRAISSSVWTIGSRRAQAVVGAFVVLAVGPLVWQASKSSFWSPEHSTAPIATLIYLAMVGAMVFRRARWAWIILVLLHGAVLVGWVIDAGSVRLVYIPLYAAGIGAFGLLLSSTLRLRLRKPVRFRERAA